MQGHSSDDKNPPNQFRQKQEPTIIKESPQNEIQDQTIQNNLPKESKIKEITHEHPTSQETRRKAHHDEQDNEEEEESSQPFKKLHLDPSIGEIESKKLKEDNIDIDFDQVYASFERVTSMKNTLENLHNPIESFERNILKYHPEDFRIPTQDLKNIQDFILTYPTEILMSFGGGQEKGFYSLISESESESKNSNINTEEEEEEDSDDSYDSSSSSVYIFGRCSSEVPEF